ncbi:hypothetical protein B0H17DRAFT_1152318 [Mycena rosella]|uniref:AAA-ATPase-like domain-containing protein n=1 Tax=Mycena rosella TaxID=1033263 RepID=A0AAD7BE17_MYCRO|nr:hypothetical protein B0H17DRAFT_1152318 [Mycena rosella]
MNVPRLVHVPRFSVGLLLTHLMTAFVDKTPCILQLPNKFQCLLLRLPRFGKTTFMSILNEYYDIHEANRFGRHFGSLASVTVLETVPQHNQHLCLWFNLLDIHVYSDITEFTAHLPNQVSFWLSMFLLQYTKELKLSDTSQIFVQNDHMFAKMLLLVTGALPVKYLALKMLGIRAPSLQEPCGFTEQEALIFTRSILGEAPDIAELHRSCGGYVLLPQNVMTEPVLHPQQIIIWISKASLPHSDADNHSLGLLTDILGLLPEESDVSVSGAVTLNALINLLAASAVEINETNITIGFDATAVSWSALYHAGALTCDRQLANTCAHRQPFRRPVRPSTVVLFPWSSYSLGEDSELFLELLSQVLYKLTQASFGLKHEPTM